RFVPQGAEYVKQGRWQTWEPALFVGQDIHHATLGIVGFGRIGLELAKRARGFDMRVIYHDQYRRPTDFEQQQAVEYRELDALLAEADFVTLHVDLNEATRKLINSARLAQMK